jgi:4-amino-4-deoxy-L-arabinose transferase-like glycosyltransferase
MVIRPTPAIVSQWAARPLSRWVLLWLLLAYVLPGFWGRQPWRNGDLAAFGVMRELAQQPSQWLEPQLLGQVADTLGWLPYWLGALAIHALPFLSPDTAARVPFALLLTLTLASTWYAMHHLARLPGAQPVSFAFGGEAMPRDYARAMADAALLALLASLGLAMLAHQSTPQAAQLAFASLLFYSTVRTVSPLPRNRAMTVGLWAAASLGLSLSGAPWLNLVLGACSLLMVWQLRPRHGAGNPSNLQPVTLGLCAVATLGATALAWGIGWPGGVWPTLALGDWLLWSEWRSLGQRLLWFTWPAGFLALWALWRWKQPWRSIHLALPTSWSLVILGAAWAVNGRDGLLLLALPPLAVLAAWALPTLRRSVTAGIDWFALLFFSTAALLIWTLWLAMVTGVPAKPAANVAKLAPGFEATFSWGLFLPAAIATLAWVGVVVWRMGRHRPAIWKSLVLSASGITLNWLLLLTLWLPLLNHGMGMEPVARRLAQATPAGACLWVHGLNQDHVAGFQFHGGLTLVRFGQAPAAACHHLVTQPSALRTLTQVTDTTEWRLVANLPRLRENRDSFLLYERVSEAAAH